MALLQGNVITFVWVKLQISILYPKYCQSKYVMMVPLLVACVVSVARRLSQTLPTCAWLAFVQRLTSQKASQSRHRSSSVETVNGKFIISNLAVSM